MKIANHKLYYGTGLSWDYIERLVCKTGGNRVYDGVNLYKNLEEITKDFLEFSDI